MKTSLSLIATIFLTGGLSAADWPQYHGANSDRTSSETIANTDWKAKPPKQLWEAATNSGFASFIVADGLAVTTIQEEIDGIPSEVCIAFDADSGETRWKANLDMWRVDHGGGNAGAPGNKGGDGPRSTPSYSDGMVYCYTSDLRLVCLSAKDGDEQWAVEVIKKHGGRNIKWDNASAPLLEGDRVIVQGGGAGESFLAFDKKDGSLRWKSGDYVMTHATPVAANINNRRQVLFFAQKGMVGVDATSGEELWFHKFPYKVSTAASAVVEGDTVYFAAGYGVGSTAIKVDGGQTEELWFSPGDKPVTNHWSTPLVKDGHLYGMFGFKQYGDGPLKCVELATGKVKWEHAGYGPAGVCLAGDDVLICLGDAGQLTLVKASPDGYEELSRIDKAIGGKCWSSPTLANGKVYIRSTTEAACLDLR